jgi:putative hydrolase of the HAD superfamily
VAAAILLDLDDTLYDEASYMRSGFAAVAAAIAGMSGYASSSVLGVLLDVERRDGRGHVFDSALAAFGMAAEPQFVQHLVTLYRSHRPRIALHPGARDLLARLRGRGRTAIVTDGLPMRQRRKIEALDLEGAVDAIVYSWELKAPKPDPKSFLHALARIGASPAEAVVVGDNPYHDMVAAQAIGAKSIRIRTGRFASMPAPPGGEPDLEIAEIGALEAALDDLAPFAAARAPAPPAHPQGVAAHA